MFRRSSAGLGLLLAMVVAGCGGSSPSTPTGPVNIGITFPFTGPYLQLGGYFSNGAGVAAKAINDNGGVMGRQMKIIDVNTGGDPVDAVPAVRQMLAVDNVSAVVGLSALDFQDALPILNQNKMVSFTHIGSPSIDHLTMPYSFSTVASDAAVGAAMVLYANQQGYRNVAIVLDAATGSQSLLPGMKYAMTKLGGMTVVASPALPEAAVSYGAEINQVINAHPDAILLQLYPASAGTFFQELKKIGGTNIPVITSDFDTSPEFVKAVGGQAYVDAHIISVLAGSSAISPAYTAYAPVYKQLYGVDPPYLSVYAFDGTTAAALAMVDAKSTDPKVYYKYILDVTTPGNGATVVYNFADGAKLLNQGKKIKFYGAGSPLVFNQYHRVGGAFEAVRGSEGGSPTHISDIDPALLDPLIG
jgi:ABC-type branched-subunit amino acid transport system substrate-binding protein